MTVKLPDELRTLVRAHPGESLELVDEQTDTAYVLVSAREFQRLKTAANDELGDTYAAQRESAMRAGWDDPRMDEYNDYDAQRRFQRGQAVAMENNDCPSGDILIGRITPPQCPHFGTRCTPHSPLGAPMVSSEGACAAYFRYRQVAAPQAIGASP